jgi:cytochrome c oxidase assembly protein Cox11
MPSPRLQRRLTIAGVLLVIAIMVGIVSISPPLYRLFCAVTGAGGTTQRAARDTATQSARLVTVFFNTDVAPGLPWRFEPVQRSVSLHLGEQTLAYFRATNLSDHPIVGHATFNVTPDKSGLYFKKIQCFCFTEERLAAHQSVEMPVQFFVDPRLGTDPNTTDVDQITLSYSFFESKNPQAAQDLARLAATPPDASQGAALFTERCAACHALDHNKVGPALSRLIGRKAGAEPGYPYSPALAAAHLTWTQANLAAWLTNPQAVIPGALMPTPATTAQDRADIIAYLSAR